MFEITEKEATGEVAEIYQDIRETMNMPFPQTIWRSLATEEGALQWVWYFFETHLSIRGDCTLCIGASEFTGCSKCFDYSGVGI